MLNWLVWHTAQNVNVYNVYGSFYELLGWFAQLSPTTTAALTGLCYIRRKKEHVIASSMRLSAILPYHEYKCRGCPLGSFTANRDCLFIKDIMKYLEQSVVYSRLYRIYI